MTETVRLALISHAMTDATAASRFPVDESVNKTGQRQVSSSIDFGSQQITVLSGPEQRCLQTARLLGLAPAVESRLADLHVGRWRGCALSDVRPADLAAWVTDPAFASHGGESVTDLMSRVRDWLESLTVDPCRIVAVTHQAVVRAAIMIALDAPPKSFWRIDIAPAARTDLHFRGHAWTLRFVGRPCS